MVTARKSSHPFVRVAKEAYLFLTERRHELAANLTDPDWLTELLNLSCIFEKINTLNLSLQGKSVDILTAYNKIKISKIKFNIGLAELKLEEWICFLSLTTISKKTSLIKEM